MDGLSDAIRALTESNRQFAQKVDEKVANLTEKVDKKHIPSNLEGDILKVMQSSVQASILSVLTGYGSPLTKLITEVVNENSGFLKQVISDSFNQVIRTDEFKGSIVAAFSHKVARAIISNNDGLFDKVSNELKQDSVFKAKMALAVSNVVEECLKKV
jgi:hypothetical protein